MNFTASFTSGTTGATVHRNFEGAEEGNGFKHHHSPQGAVHVRAAPQKGIKSCRKDQSHTCHIAKSPPT